MNLWVKRTGQLLLAALFLIACEDDSFLLGFKNQNKKFNVKYQEFQVGDGTILSVDSIITDNPSGTGIPRLLIGEDEDPDPILGTMRAEAFTQFLGDQTQLTTKNDHVYWADSLVVQLQLDYYSYGLEGNAVGRFSVRRITDETPLSYTTDEYYTRPGSDKEILVKKTNHYYATSTVDTTGSLGQTRFEKLYLDSKKKEKRITTTITFAKLSGARDTLIATARLSDAFRDELFNVALNNPNSEFSDITKFRSRFKGLAFAPLESNSILGFSTNGSYTRLRLYYHSTLGGVVVDTLSRDFKFTNQVSFSNLSPTRSMELPAVEPPYSGVDVSNLRVVQNGNTMITKIDLGNFYNEFADQVDEENIVINGAELIIESVNTSEEYKPIPQLELRIMEENDSYLNYRKMNQQDRDSLRKFWLFSDGRHYYVNSDFQSQTPIQATLTYNSTKKNYSGSLTLFVQSLFDRKSSNYRTRYIGLYPATSIGKTVDRSVFLKENIKLRIYYTLPNRSNL